MKPEFQIAIQSRVPVLFTSEPGMAKTAEITALAKGLNQYLATIIGSIYEPSDIGGFPQVVDRSVEYMPPHWAKEIVKQGGGMIFFDELTSCPPPVQAAMLRVLCERHVGFTRLPDETMLVAACNPSEHAVGGYELSAPMANRFCHLTWNPESEAWCNYMSGGNGNAPANVTVLPKDWEDELPTARATVAAYIHANPQALHSMPADPVKRSGPWPSRRTWYYAAQMMAACKAAEVPDDELIAGCVGADVMVAFDSWREKLDLPDPNEALKHPDTFVLPKKDDVAYITLNSIAMLACQSGNVDTWLDAWKIMDRVCKAGRTDIAVFPSSTLIKSRQKGWPVPKSCVVMAPTLQEMGM